jgi:hypothetical protein
LQVAPGCGRAAKCHNSAARAAGCEWLSEFVIAVGFHAVFSAVPFPTS